jgi:hypothetical protein
MASTTFWQKIKTWLGFGKNKCVCAQEPGGTKFYCYKKTAQGYEACSGPYTSLQECKDQSGEKCPGS